ncbi:tryptophan-rich sensory protein [Methanobrevibacter sp. TMH8]|uniref:TspO/MBR family protein n=1 Tax=Methanobrevibacter sp. TMH8 TaxID=2848611 RepID=UPI001CCBD8EC|nr:TspO/MBR family protein [Methanobrevibacter sp. TMH8]MBZ9570776.1 tryptophan-rich sensory protein [Methanobrevibacter sp. TMH8]
MNSIKRSNIFKLIISFVIVFVIGIIGSLVTYPQIATWYASIIKPSWTPAGWVFPIVWNTLYILMSISLFLVLKENLSDKKVKFALAIFGIQLALNLLWSIVFFGFHSIIGGLGVILMLWIFILMNIFVFYKISKWAGILLVPYIIWVTIATYLNYSIYLLNF